MKQQDQQLEELARQRIEASLQQQDNRLLGNEEHKKQSRYSPLKANRITVPKHSSSIKRKMKDHCNNERKFYDLENKQVNEDGIGPSQSMFQIEDHKNDKLLQTPSQDIDTPQS